MRLVTLGLEHFGALRDVSLPLGPGLTVVVGPNESGKSTTLSALAALLWGVPSRGDPLFDLVPRARLRLSAELAQPGSSELVRLVRDGRGLFAGDALHSAANPWGSDGEEQRRGWLQRFGLSHLTLREGGLQVCDGSGDLAELVFTARQGEWMRELLRRTEQQADQLFKDHRGNKSVKIRVAMENYNQAKAAHEHAVTNAATVAEAGAAVRALERDVAAATDEATVARRRLDQLNEYRRCLPDVGRLLAVRHDLAEIGGRGPALEPDDLIIFDKAVATVAETDRELEQLGVQLETWRREHRDLAVDEQLLADGFEVDELVAQLAARVADRDRALALEQRAAAGDRQAGVTLDTLLGQHDQRPVAERLDALGVAADLAGQIDEAAQSQAGLRTAVTTAEAGVRQAREVLDGLPALDSLPEAADIGPLVEMVTALTADDGPLAVARDATAMALADRHACRRALLAAGGQPATSQVPPVPDEDSITRDVDRLTEATSVVRLAEQRLEQARSGLASATDALRRAETVTLVDPERVTAARAERDACWLTIRDCWVEGVALPGPTPVTLARAFETAMRTSDELADQVAADSKQAAKLIARRQTVAESQQALSHCEIEYAKAATELDECQAQWGQRWSALGIEPPAPAKAPVVRQHLAEAAAADLRAIAADGEAMRTAPEIRTWIARLVPIMAGLGRPVPGGAAGSCEANPCEANPGDDDTGHYSAGHYGTGDDGTVVRGAADSVAVAVADLEALLAAANALIKEVDEAREPRQQLRTGQQALDRANAALRASEQDLATWAESWRRLTGLAGMGDAMDPTGWAVRCEHLATARATYDEAQRHRGEADELLAAWTSFAERVAAVARRNTGGERRPGDLAVSCANTPVGDLTVALGALESRLRQSRADQQLYRTRQADIVAGEERLAEVEQRRGTAMTMMEELRRRHGLATGDDPPEGAGSAREVGSARDAGLVEAAARGRDRDRLLAEEAELVRQLLAKAEPGRAIDTLIDELADLDDAALGAQLTVAEAELGHADDRSDTLLQELGGARREHTDLRRRGNAADLHARANSHLAEVAVLAEQYAVLHLQRLLLHQQLESHARQHTSPLLESAGQMLEVLSAGRWVALEAAHSDGARHLEIVRGDGTPVRASALSEGTADQVFLALRLAGIVQQQNERMARGQTPLPVVFDDVLMTFDDRRAKLALRLLAETAANMQIILFTHHDHVADLAEGLVQSATGRDPDVATGEAAAGLRRPEITVARLEPAALFDGASPAEIRSAVRQRRSAQPIAETLAATPATRRALATFDGGEHGVERSGGQRVDPAKVRIWAKANDIPVADRGRIREEIVAQYLAATGQ